MFIRVIIVNDNVKNSFRLWNTKKSYPFTLAVRISRQHLSMSIKIRNITYHRHTKHHKGFERLQLILEGNLEWKKHDV